MPLPTSVVRSLLHTRSTVFRGFKRDDGLWDIEGELLDTKAHGLPIPGEPTLAPGAPLHGMTIRVTINAHYVIQAIVVSMDAAPHRECPQSMVNMQSMVGCTMGRGWRKAIERHLGGIGGCTHLRELLFNMATAAFQTIAHATAEPNPQQPPPYFGTCTTWDFNGPVVARLFPQFAGGPAKGREAAITFSKAHID